MFIENLQIPCVSNKFASQYFLYQRYEFMKKEKAVPVKKPAALPHCPLDKECTATKVNCPNQVRT